MLLNILYTIITTTWLCLFWIYTRKQVHNECRIWLLAVIANYVIHLHTLNGLFAYNEWMGNKSVIAIRKDWALDDIAIVVFIIILVQNIGDNFYYNIFVQ